MGSDLPVAAPGCGDEQRATTNTFITTGSDIIRYEDPQTGDTYGVMRIAR